MAATLVDDLYGVDVIAITDGQALRAEQFIPDVTLPNLLFYSLDLNTGILLLSFDEAVSNYSHTLSMLNLLISLILG